MLHSKQLNEPPLKSWVIAEEVDTVVSAYPTRMVGFPEVCTHIASSVYWLQFTVKRKESMTDSDTKAYWVVPS